MTWLIISFIVVFFAGAFIGALGVALAAAGRETPRQERWSDGTE